ncbi:MAG: HD domain-containing protein [Anaeroplasmataceae bacterium]|nr:HD domain-containing protein [Anaeroplasmataceae bacterium]
MQTRIDKYLENLNKIVALDDQTDYKNLSIDDLLEVLYQNAVLKNKLANENNQLIQEVIKPLELKKELLKEEREKIEEFILILQTGYESKDNGMLFRLYQILLHDALSKNNLNQIIKCLYYCSYYDFLIQSMHPRKYRTSSFNLIEKYKDSYDLLSVEGKSYFLRCYGNQTLMEDYSLTKFKEILDFIKLKKETEPNEKIPYDAYIVATEKNICNGLEIIRSYTDQGIEVPTELKEGIYEVASHLYKNLDSIAKTSLPIRQVYLYSYYAACFHNNKITVDDFLDKLDSLTKIDESYSLAEKSTCIIKMNSVYILYYMKYKVKDKSTLKKDLKDRIEMILSFVKTIKASEYTRNMNSDLISFIQIASKFYPYEDLEPLLIQATAKRHTPTAIHSQSVAELCRIVLEYMLDTNPEFFLGILDNYSLSEILLHREDLMKLIYRMGMIHDIGKYYCIPYISINYRKLEDAEFEAIKFHPILGYDMLNGNFPDALCDAVLYHHVWHDNTKGYPLDYKHTNNLPLIDILSACDTIDAAVDFLGRSYVMSKTFSQLLVEFNEFKGTRYSKEIVEALNSEVLRAKIESYLKNRRKQIVYQAFILE